MASIIPSRKFYDLGSAHFREPRCPPARLLQAAPHARCAYRRGHVNLEKISRWYRMRRFKTTVHLLDRVIRGQPIEDRPWATPNLAVLVYN